MTRWWHWDYTALRINILDRSQKSNEDNSDDLWQEKAKPPRSSGIGLKLAITVLAIWTITILVAVRAVSTRLDFYESTHSRIPFQCGNSTAEALARGCSWDQLTWSWYPPHCPHYANDEFMDAEPWVYYADPYGKTAVEGDTFAQAMDNRTQLYGERREHMTHCVYLFLSLGQIVRDGTRHVERLVEYEHLHHCAKIILEVLQQDAHWHDMETSVPQVSYSQSC